MEDTFSGQRWWDYDEFLQKRYDANSAVVKASNQLKRYCREHDTDDVSQILGDLDLGKREFIELIALFRVQGYDPLIGGGNKEAENETDTLYGNNPWRFVEEFLQNADDCNYKETPEIDITIDERDPSHPSIEFAYNEVGFSMQDVWAITYFSKSNKTGDLVEFQEADGVYYREKTGRKGIGFKSVFSLDAKNVIIHISSHGYSFRIDDNLGRLLPIWEDNSQAGDGKTHVRVELIEPTFSLGGIYPEFKHMFSVDDVQEIFSRSPLLFMHHLKSVHVSTMTNSGSDQFRVSYVADREKTVYIEPFELNPSKMVLGGIAKDEAHYKEQVQEGIIEMREGNLEVTRSVRVLRYTRMVEEDATYSNYSVFGPIFDENEAGDWTKGSLFRTFPMPKHSISMPLSIDAPFILEKDRSGIEYSSTTEQSKDRLPAALWNTLVSQRLFGKGGVVESFLLHLRTLEGIRMDRYLTKGSVTLFDDGRNNDGHGSRFVDHVDLMKVCKSIPVFRLEANPDEYTSLDEAIFLERGILAWPKSETLLKAMLGHDFERFVISSDYEDCGLKNSRSLVTIAKVPFASALDAYLDELEQTLATNELAEFFENSLYPYLFKSRAAIAKKEGDAFKKMHIFLSNVKTAAGTVVVREAHSQDVIWLHYEGDTPPTSFGKYRIFESSPADLSSLSAVLRNALGSKKLAAAFSERGLRSAASTCRTWEQVRDLLLATNHFGYELPQFTLKALKGYSLDERLDPEPNAFRTTDVVHTIPEGEITEFAESLGIDVPYACNMLRRLGLKRPDDYFTVSGSYIQFGSDTLEVLKSKSCTIEMLDKIFDASQAFKKDINADAASLSVLPEQTLLYLLVHGKGYLSPESFTSLCNAVQRIPAYWGRNDIVARELLLRAGAHSNEEPPHELLNDITFTITEILAHHLEYEIKAAHKKNFIDSIHVVNDESFTIIDKQRELIPLLKLMGINDWWARRATYYFGDLGDFGRKEHYLTDGVLNVYLQVSESGGYRESLEHYVGGSFDRKKTALLDEMEKRFATVKNELIAPILFEYELDHDRTYKQLNRSFDQMSKRDVIGVISWYRYTSYSAGFGNSSANNEAEIADDYRNDPWKFLYEFIQNVDDNRYEERAHLAITISEETNSVTFEYNELGFTQSDVIALTNFGQSNKQNELDDMDSFEGVFDRQRTGRKGRGFKSVFALEGDDICVHVLSGGYSFKIAKCLGSIIPIWEDVDNDLSGTRIIVEGFVDGYLRELKDRVHLIFGTKDLSGFFATCPMLFLRKLKDISIDLEDDVISFSVGRDETDTREFFGDKGLPQASATTGIMHEGHLYDSLWETMHISVSANGETNRFSAAQYSATFTYPCNGNSTQGVASILAPVIDDNATISFSGGSLFRTLPLSEQSLPIPLAINAPFDPDSGRAAVDDSASTGNTGMVRFVFGTALEGFYRILCEMDGIHIECYIPKGKSTLFKDYHVIPTIEFSDNIRKLPILESYVGDCYVSPQDARTLPAACYEWHEPQTLFAHFDNGKHTLVAARYLSAGIGIRSANMVSVTFHKRINAYLSTISLDDSARIKLMQDHVFPYITQNFSQLESTYRSVRKFDDLKLMCVFAFEMSDGSIVWENAVDSRHWLDDTPDGKQSFRQYRCLNGGVFKDLIPRPEWIDQLHKPFRFEDTFSKTRLVKYNYSNWQRASSLISTLLYYSVDIPKGIEFFSNCALSEDLDPTENIFRDAFLTTGNRKILTRVIDRNDLLELMEQSLVVDSMTLQQVADTVSALGLRKPDDFFNSVSHDYFAPKKQTLALLCDYCQDKDVTDKVLDALEQALLSQRRKPNSPSRLLMSYEDLSDASPWVFTGLFVRDLLSGDTLSDLARKFCDSYPMRDDTDYVEAYLRGLTKLGNVSYKRALRIDLSEVCRRNLIECVQSCMARSSPKVKLTVNIDLEHDDYPRDEVDKALEWLGSNKIKINYAYYTADLAGACGQEGKSNNLYVFDGTKVILNEQCPLDCLHSFVDKLFGRGSNSAFQALFNIVTSQKQLKEGTFESKEEYITSLQQFRESTKQQIELLAPGYIDNINAANARASAYVLPELLQNINDCARGEHEEERTLDVIIDEKANTMLLRYDEAGFTFDNVYSITALGASTKHDKSEGEKGLGFKKIIKVLEYVEIYSNGFAFSLSAEEPTIPVWIGDEERKANYEVQGKTTMLFKVKENKRVLKELHKEWKMIVNGQYVGTMSSPIFCHNIDRIRVVGYDSIYERKEMKKQFLTYKANVLELYGSLLRRSGTGMDMSHVRAMLASRRKCKLMSASEAQHYVESLTVEVFLPTSVNEKNRKAGRLYSTLVTEVSLGSAILVNAPFELTTGRDSVDLESKYNRTLLDLLFKSLDNAPSLVISMLETIASQHHEVCVIDYISSDLDAFGSSIAKLAQIKKIEVLMSLSRARLLESATSEKMVPLRDAYGVDEIVYRYIVAVKPEAEAIDKLMMFASHKARSLNLVIPKTLTSLQGIEKLAKQVQFTDRFPIQEKDKDIVLGFFATVYGKDGDNGTSRVYEKDDARDAFITDRLIHDLIGRVNALSSGTRKATAREVAKLRIFPYRSRGKTMLGCLSNPSVKWYYIDKKATLTIKPSDASESYRILDDSVLTEQHFQELTSSKLFDDYLKKYSNQIVIEGLVKQMSKESDYTDLWWSRAAEIIRLWNPDAKGTPLMAATKGIAKNNKGFLFTKQTSGLQDELIDAGIFSDVIDAKARKHIGQYLDSKSKDTYALLKDMGVPHKLIISVYKPGSDAQKMEVVHPRLTSFAFYIHKSIDFTHELSQREKDQCNLSKRVFVGLIRQQSSAAFDHALSDTACAGGIPILNARREYVPLSWDLFYDTLEFTHNTVQDDVGSYSDWESEPTKQFRYKGGFERLVLERSNTTKSHLDRLSRIHCFSEIDKPYSAYKLGGLGGEADFYKWAWGHSQHEKLAKVILGYFTSQSKRYGAITGEDALFAIHVASTLTGSADYHIVIKLTVEEAFSVAAKINRIVKKKLTGIHITLTDNLRHLPKDDFIHQLLADSAWKEIDRSVRQKVENDPIWDNTFFPQRQLKWHQDSYVCCQDSSVGLIDILVFACADSIESQVRTAMHYIDDKYDTDLLSRHGSLADARTEYNALVSGIRFFLQEEYEGLAFEGEYRFRGEMDNVKLFSEEKRIWNQLRAERQTLLSGSRINVSFDYRGFLSGQYGGICQLCFADHDDRHVARSFYTYRLVKKSANSLSDLRSNLFSLCPSCHGSLLYGDMSGRSLRPIVEAAREYAKLMDDMVNMGNTDNDMPSYVSDYADTEGTVEGLVKPIVFDVRVFGQEHRMVFSWEHFMRIAFMFSSIHNEEIRKANVDNGTIMKLLDRSEEDDWRSR